MIYSKDVAKKSFTKAFRGYDVQEVDLYLDEIIKVLANYEEERDMLLSRIEALLDELEKNK